MKDSLLEFLFGVYRRVVSPVLHSLGRSQCIYLPTCSEYALVAMQRFGVIRGGAMALRRIGRCYPLAEGGFDPVPER